MRTAEETLFLILDVKATNGQKIFCIKEYGRQCAEHALKDAAKKYEDITMYDKYGCICNVPQAILTTEIITP